MGLSIEDGKGNGFQAEVDDRNMLHTHSVSESLEHDANLNGNSYNILFSQTSDTTGACILYIKNGFNEDLIFEGITIRTAEDTEIYIKINDSGDPTEGVSTTPINLNAGSGKLAEGSYLTGSGMEGLFGGSTALTYFIKGGESSSHYNFEQDIIIPKNRVLTLCCEIDNVKVDGFLAFFRDNLDAG